MRTALWLAVLGASAALAQGTEALEREMARIGRVAGGIVGAAAIHIESGRKASINGDELFPMASTCKVPLAVQLLHRIDRGEERLDRMVTIESRDLHPGSGTLTPLINQPGLALSVRNLMELMLTISDNSATDVLLKLAGGPEAVTQRMRTLGFQGIRYGRPTIEVIADIAGLGAENLPPESERTPQKIRVLLDGVPEQQGKAALTRFLADQRDTARPADMATLLARIHKNDVMLKPESVQLLLEIMQRCQTGEARIKGLLPAGTAVAHKTGSLNSVANDVGIVTLPENRGHVALAVFVKASDKSTAARDRGIAEIARAVYDYFLFSQDDR